MSDKKYSAADVFRACKKARIETLTMYRWRPFYMMRNMLVPEDVIVGTWASKWEQEYGKPPNILNESTYDDCIRIELDLNTGVISAWMDDGDMVDGLPLKLRCSWSISPCPENRDRLHELFVEAGISRLGRAALHAREVQIAAAEAAKVRAIFEGYFK